MLGKLRSVRLDKFVQIEQQICKGLARACGDMLPGNKAMQPHESLDAMCQRVYS
jgi:hypothetical protein